MKKNKLDLYLSAHAAAVANLDTADAFTLQTNALDTFKKDGFDTADYSTWETMFNNARTQMNTFKTQSLLSTKAAAKAEKLPAAPTVPKP